MGIFDTALAIQAQERELQAQRAGGGVQGGLFNLGDALGDAIQRAFGGDPRSQAVREAEQINQIANQADFNDPSSILQTANRLNAAGFQDQAFKFLSAVPPEKTPDKRVVDRFTTTEVLGNTTKRFLWERDNFGFTRKLGEISDTTPTDQFFKHNVSFEKDVQFDDDSRGTFLGRLANRPEFKSFVDDTDPEELTQFTGLIARVANDLKDSHRDDISRAFLGGDLTAQEAALNTARSDDFYLDLAYRRFVEGGGIEANIDRGFGLLGADVELDPNRDTADPESLFAQKVRTEKRAAALNDVASRLGRFVVADPSGKGFRMDKLSQDQASLVFERMDAKTDEDMRAQLEGMGFKFTPELFESHRRQWQILRENPVPVAKYLALQDNEDLQSAERARFLSELESADDFMAFAETREVFKYLDRLTKPKINPGTIVGGDQP